MEPTTMTRDDTDLLNYLLTAEFDVTSGLSYGEALGLLQQYQRLYRQLYDKYASLKRQEDIQIRLRERLQQQIDLLQTKVDVRTNHLDIMEQFFTRKLTWSERIFGRLKL